jgi:hypothetical protein
LFARFASLQQSEIQVGSAAETQSSLIDASDILNRAASKAGKSPEAGQLAGAADLSRAAGIPAARRLSSLDVREEVRQSSIPSAPALQGARLLRMFPDEGIFYLQLTPGSTVTARKRAAEQLCGGRTECQVYGWWSADAIPQRPQLDAASRALLAFTFAKHAQTGVRSQPPSAMTM